MENHITKESAINTLIASDNVNTNLISDGYHTFGELYEHRITLFIALCKQMQKYSDHKNEIFVCWRSQLHSDGSGIPGWFVLGMLRDKGEQMTYHLPMAKWDQCQFAETLECAPEWDGHTSQDVLDRINRLPLKQ